MWGGAKLKFPNIELMRFLVMLLIMGHHLYHIGLEGAYLTRNCWVWVDFYFIISGAFTYAHFQVHSKVADGEGSEALAYTLRKFKKFLIPVISTVVIQYCLDALTQMQCWNVKEFIKGMLYLPYEVMFLSSSGIVNPMVAPIWYLSAMFIVLPLVAYLIQAHKELWKIVAFTLPILYFGHKGVNTDRAWPNDMVRAFVCLSLGTIVYLLAAQIKKLPDNRVSKGLFSALEIMSVIVAMYISIFNKPFLNLMELLFVIICVFMLSGRTISASWSAKIIFVLGSLSMPMYIFHWTIGSVAVLLTKNIAKRLFIYFMGTIVISGVFVFWEKRLKF